MFKSLWAYDQCLSRDECYQVIEYAEKFLKTKPGPVTTHLNVNKDIRDSQIAWVNRHNPKFDWLFKTIDQRVWDISRSWFDVDYHRDGCDAFQYTIYTKDQFYGKHIDTFYQAGELIQRKISASILLSDPADFEGGQLLVGGGTLDAEQMEIGQIYVFPSIISHEVTAVTAGIRRSLVAWYTGPSWR